MTSGKGFGIVVPSMKRLSSFLFFSLLMVLVTPGPWAHAAWVWSPQTGWIGPGGAVKDTPQEQLAVAIALFDRQEYAKAKREFAKLLRAYEDSREAAEAQYYFGRCYEALGDSYRAFREYRKTIQRYPATTRFEELLERQYHIGEAFLAGKKRKLLGTVAILPARDKAAEIFDAVAEDGPFTAYGPLAQYKLGLTHVALRDYEAAVTEFDKLVTRYPDSPLVDDAKFQIAQASLKGTFRAGYDQAPADRAIRELEQFLQEHPESELAAQASQRLTELIARRAQHEYLVAQFYERRRKLAAARIYYETIATRYGQTPTAPQAAARLAVLDAPH